jgi:hypothetical protein
MENGLIVMGNLPKKKGESGLIIMGDLSRWKNGLIVMGGLPRDKKDGEWSHCNG